MTTHSIAEQKRELRVKARTARQALTPEQRAQASRRICEKLLSMPEVSSAHSVLGYAASLEEADPATVLDTLLERGVRVALPCVRSDRSLSIHWVDAETPLECGAFGLRQPGEHEPEAPYPAIDLVIVPLVAFDECANRIGYGGGYYDRLFMQVPPDAPRIGIAFDEQLVEDAPVEPHDQPLDAVVTPSRIVRRCEAR